MSADKVIRILVWQWGRRGAGPRYAAELAEAFNGQSRAEAFLSLSLSAELLNGETAPECALPVRTYTNLLGYLGRLAAGPIEAARLVRWLRAQEIDVALCAMPAAMDLVMSAALRLAGIPYAVVVHEAQPHFGDRYPSQLMLQRLLVRGAGAVFVLSSFVATQLENQGGLGARHLFRTTLPPFFRQTDLSAPGQHGGKLRLLSFGRLLSYKGLDLLADSLELLPRGTGIVVRVVGSGPESADLDRLRALPDVVVENRWVAEEEVPSLIGWADALVLSYREASQSGVAAAAAAANRWIVATRVGGLAEQLAFNQRAILCEPTAASLAEGIHSLLERNLDGDGDGGPGSPAWPEVARAVVDDLRQFGKPAGPEPVIAARQIAG